MTKTDLISNLAKKVDITKADAAIAIDGLTELIIETIKSGDTVNIQEFGSFEMQTSKERNGVNPKTSEKIVISPKNSLKFKCSPKLRKSLNA